MSQQDEERSEQETLTPEEREEFKRSVTEFASLYQLVRDEVDARADALKRNDAAASQFLGDLNRDFLERFENWEHHSGLAEYLRCFNDTGKPKILRVSAYLFLHIAHDMPLSIRAKLQGIQAADRGNLRRAYLELAGIFPEILKKAAKEGLLGFYGRFMGLGFMPSSIPNTVAQWALALRSQAWICGEILTDQEDEVVLSEEAIRRIVIKGGLQASEARWLLGLPIPFDWRTIVTHLFMQFIYLFTAYGLGTFSIQLSFLPLTLSVGHLFVQCRSFVRDRVMLLGDSICSSLAFDLQAD